MAKQRTGTVAYVEAKARSAGHYKARITCPNGSRPWIHLPPAVRSPEAEAEARRLAVEYSARVVRENLVPSPPKRMARPGATPDESETFSEYAARWFADRDRRGLSSVDTDRGRFQNHVFAVLGELAIRDVTEEHLRKVVEALDGKVLDGVLAGKTATTIWGLVTRLFRDARSSKTQSLRVRTDNPARDVERPDVGVDKAKQWLFPSEAVRLLECTDVRSRWRELYALMLYLYLRPGELAALRGGDVNLEHGYVSITRAWDFRRKRFKATKTGITRRVPIPPALVPLLKRLQTLAGIDGLLVQNKHPNKKVEHGLPPLEALSTTFRCHLKRAGVTRPELFEDSVTAKNITFYDLRATGITWEVFAGTDHVMIQRRAGHAQFSTTEGYIRQAVDMKLPPTEPSPFPPYRPVESSPNRPQSSKKVLSAGINSRILASPTGFESRAGHHRRARQRDFCGGLRASVHERTG